MPNVLSPRDLVFRPDNGDETVPHTHTFLRFCIHGHLCGDLFSLIAELDYARTMYIIYIYIFIAIIFFTYFSFTQKL